MWILGLKGLSKGVFERRTSTGSEVISLIVCLEATKFVLVSVVILCPKSEKGSLPVVVRRSKASFLVKSRGNILSGLSDPQNR